MVPQLTTVLFKFIDYLSRLEKRNMTVTVFGYLILISIDLFAMLFLQYLISFSFD